MCIKKNLPLLIFCFISSFVTAQLKTWSWSDYKMQFKAPVDFKIDENTSSKFAAGMENCISLFIQKREPKYHTKD